MEISSFKCLADLGMDDPFLMHEWPHADSIDGSFSTTSTLFDYNFDNYQSYNNNNNNNAIHSKLPMFDFKRSSPESSLVDDYSNIRPSKQIKTVKNDNGLSYSPSLKEETVYKYCSGTALNFSSGESVVSTGNQNYVAKSNQGVKGVSSGSNSSRLSQDHIIAERKRREKLSQRFIALSTLLPGLKKMDKASVLGDAINHIKQLQEKVRALEDQTQKKTMESMVFVRKYEVACLAESGEDSSMDDRSTSSGGPTATTTESLPEIEARFCGRDVLISILCEKRKGVIEKIVGEVEKLHMSVVNSSIMSFGDSALSITVVAQKDEELSNNMDFVKNLRGALKKIM